MQTHLYRYERYIINNIGAKIILYQHEVIRETPQGFWIKHYDNTKWVSKTGKKKFAYLSKEDAMKNFVLRTKKCIKILENQLQNAKMYLDAALKPTEKTITTSQFENLLWE